MKSLKNLEKSAADLARLNKMKDSFLGLASHELKTPLTVIMGYAELITTDMAEKVDQDRSGNGAKHFQCCHASR